MSFLSLPAIRNRMVRCASAATALLWLVGTAGAQVPDAVGSAMRTASSPFGALSLFVLAGTLFAGIVSGIGLASLRRPAFAGPSAGTTPAQNLPAPSPEPTLDLPPVKPARDLPVIDALPPIVAELDGGGEKDAAFWIEDLANGPRFGPRIVGIVVASDCDGDDALARLATIARDTDHDLAVVDACRGADRLAAALDLRLDRPLRRPEMAAGARVEIVPFSELLKGRGRRDGEAMRAAFAALAARVDVVLVDLPAIADWRKNPGLIDALDGVTLLRTERTRSAELQKLCESAHDAGAPITGQVLVLDEAA